MRHFSVSDAVLRTIWRMLFANKRLLEWNPSGDSDRTSRKDLAGVCRTMWISPVIAVAVAIYLALSRPEALLVRPACSGPLVYLSRSSVVDQRAPWSP